MDKGAMTMDAMYRVCTEFTMPDGVVITVRTLSDVEVQTKNRLALEDSRSLMGKLKDESSDRYRETIAPLQTLDREAMVAALSVIRRRELYRESPLEVPFPFIPIPDGASLEERQAALGKRETSEAETRLKREAWVGERSEQYAEKIGGLDHDALLGELTNKTIMAYSYAEYMEQAQYATLLMACHKPDGSRFFRDVAAVRDTSGKVLDKLFAAYREVDQVDPWELEKNA